MAYERWRNQSIKNLVSALWISGINLIELYFCFTVNLRSPNSKVLRKWNAWRWKTLNTFIIYSAFRMNCIELLIVFLTIIWHFTLNIWYSTLLTYFRFFFQQFTVTSGNFRWFIWRCKFFCHSYWIIFIARLLLSLCP